MLHTWKGSRIDTSERRWTVYLKWAQGWGRYSILLCWAWLRCRPRP